MKIESLLHIAKIIEQQNMMLQSAIDKIWEMQNPEDELARIERQLQQNKDILVEMKHEIKLIEQYGEAYVKFDPQYITSCDTYKNKDNKTTRPCRKRENTHQG